MDSEHWNLLKKLKIIGESKAGDVKGIKINNQECVLIYTGAPIDGKDKKVVPKENFETVNNHIHIKKVSTDSFVRKKGLKQLRGQLLKIYKSPHICLHWWALSMWSLLVCKGVRLSSVAGGGGGAFNTWSYQ